MSPHYLEVETPLGDLTIVASASGVVATLSEADRAAGALESLERATKTPARRAPRELAPVRRELTAYFAGELRAFATPVDLTATGRGFVRRALEVVLLIPYGEMCTYGDVADAAGSPRGGRAAGGALRRCPIEILVPCHRVVGAGHALGGYGGHDDRKRFLLRLEGAIGREVDGRLTQ
jgi:methylated-DNA-[protein]-cysteine S-methyltransferase